MNANITPPATSTPDELPPETRRRITDILSREEIRALTARSDLMGFWSIFQAWAVIALAFAALAIWPNPFTFIITLVVIAGRQLALAILTHEGTHGTLFATRWLNEVFTDWTCARPVWLDLAKYRAHHLIHHTKTGTVDDSDISLVEGFPTTRSSLVRKLLRDALGLTGLKFLFGRVLMDAGLLRYTVASDVTWLPRGDRGWHDYSRDFFRNATPMILTNLALFAVLAASGHGWLYGVWVLAQITPFPLFLRIRSLAEHACTERTTDMFRNTRSTKANLFWRALVAPFRVHYHIEHHVMASVPWYRLPALHALLKDRGLVAPPPGYADVLRIVSTPAAAQQ